MFSSNARAHFSILRNARFPDDDDDDYYYDGYCLLDFVEYCRVGDVFLR